MHGSALSNVLARRTGGVQPQAVYDHCVPLPVGTLGLQPKAESFIAIIYVSLYKHQFPSCVPRTLMVRDRSR